MQSFVITDMSRSNKSTTPAAVYRQMFKDIATKFEQQDWKFVYTDGTKIHSTTAFAVVDSNHNTITVGHLLPFCSVYTAEASAVLRATQFALGTKEKYIVCSDSLSTIQSITNMSSTDSLTASIRKTLLQSNSRIKIMWVPSHVSIAGNEAADERVKLAAQEPLIVQNFISKRISPNWLKYTYLKQNSKIGRIISTTTRI